MIGRPKAVAIFFFFWIGRLLAIERQILYKVGDSLSVAHSRPIRCFYIEVSLLLPSTERQLFCVCPRLHKMIRFTLLLPYLLI